MSVCCKELAVMFRLSQPELWVSGLIRGVHELTLTPNLASSWKTTSSCRRTLTGGCWRSTVPTVTAATLLGLRYKASTCTSCQNVAKVRLRRRRVTRFSCTSVLDRGASRPVRFTGGDFRLINAKTLRNYIITTTCKAHRS